MAWLENMEEFPCRDSQLIHSQFKARIKYWSQLCLSSPSNRVLQSFSKSSRLHNFKMATYKQPCAQSYTSNHLRIFGTYSSLKEALVTANSTADWLHIIWEQHHSVPILWSSGTEITRVYTQKIIENSAKRTPCNTLTFMHQRNNEI